MIFPDNEEHGCLGTVSAAELAAILKYTDYFENVNSENSEQWFEVCTVLGMRH
jgi:hypothetical protein